MNVAVLVLIGSARLRRRHFKSRSLVNSYRAGAHCDLVTHDGSALFSVLRASDCQCQSRNSPDFDPTNPRHSGIRGAADEAVLNEEHKKSPFLNPVRYNVRVTRHKSALLRKEFWCVGFLEEKFTLALASLAGPQAGWGLGWLLPALQLLISVGGTPGGQSTALGGPIHYCIGGGPPAFGLGSPSIL